jgi:DNA-binding Xre family transcriptional regulator
MLDVDQIKQRRLKLGLKMELAAQRAGFSGEAQWYLIESGRRTDVALSTLDKLAEALECDAKDLLK